MENNNQLQLQMSNSNLPAITTAESLAQIRMDERSYPHYKSVTRQARLEWLANQIKYLASITRMRDFDAREAILMATALDDIISMDAVSADLTLAEMADAFKKGVFGFYGEFYGVSAPNLYGFLDKFITSEIKKEATALVLKSHEGSYAEKKTAEKEEQQRRIREEIEEAKRAGTFVPTGQVWFKPQMVNDAVSSKEHREKVRQQAREILNQQ